MFYNRLVKMGFRAHHVSEIYKRAKEVVESTRKNSGSKPVLRKLTARIHTLDYRLDLDKKIIKIAVLYDKWVELKLEWYSYLNKYPEGSWKPGEIIVSYMYGRFYVYITFHRDIVPREPQTVMGVDINFNNITCTIIDLNSELVSIGVIPFKGLKKALHYRKLAENLQRRYPKNWRFLKWARRVRARWLSKARYILVDTAHYVSKRLVEVAREYNAVIVFEVLFLRTTAIFHGETNLSTSPPLMATGSPVSSPVSPSLKEAFINLVKSAGTQLPAPPFKLLLIL